MRRSWSRLAATVTGSTVEMMSLGLSRMGKEVIICCFPTNKNLVLICLRVATVHSAQRVQYTDRRSGL